MILVSGANGKFAGEVIKNLRKLLPVDGRFVVGTRDPDSDFARGLVREGIGVRRMDFNRPETLHDALQGIEKSLIVSTGDANDVRPTQHRNAINAAKAAGVHHIVYTSFINAVPESFVQHNQLVHAPTEKAIRESGLTYTILRHALYSEVILIDLKQTLSTGRLVRGGSNTPIAFISREDLGVSAARVLTGKGHENRVYTETAPEALSNEQCAAVITEVFGVRVTHHNLTPEEWAQHVQANWGAPEAAAKAFGSTMRAIEKGEFNVVSPDYEAITGKPARTLRQFLEDFRRHNPS